MTVLGRQALERARCRGRGVLLSRRVAIARRACDHYAIWPSLPVGPANRSYALKEAKWPRPATRTAPLCNYIDKPPTPPLHPRPGGKGPAGVRVIPERNQSPTRRPRAVARSLCRR